jgi:hypothetical protein
LGVFLHVTVENVDSRHWNHYLDSPEKLRTGINWDQDAAPLETEAGSDSKGNYRILIQPFSPFIAIYSLFGNKFPIAVLAETAFLTLKIGFVHAGTVFVLRCFIQTTGLKQIQRPHGKNDLFG